MTAIAAPTAHLGAVAKQPATAVIGYGFGDFAMNLSFSMSTSFVLYYFTDVGGLSAAPVGTMFLVARLWDAFTDLFAGRAVIGVCALPVGRVAVIHPFTRIAKSHGS